MACEVLWTEAARADVDRAVRYITAKLSSPAAAAGLLDALNEAAGEISEFPEARRVASHPSLASRKLRVRPVKRYLLLYSYDGETVIVSRMFHSLQDYARLIDTSENA